MRLIPAHLAEIAAGEEAPTLAPYGLKVGDRVEVDIERLEEAEARLAEQIDRYLARLRQFRKRPAGEYIAAEVEIVDAIQKGTREGKVDLRAQLAALERTAAGALVAEALSAEPDMDAVGRLGERYQVSWQDEGDSRATCSFTLFGKHEYPRELGGASGTDEVARKFTLHISYAAWRDRRVRRLTRLTIHAVHVLPTPEGHTP